MITANEVREITIKVKEERIEKSKEAALRIVDEVIEPLILDAAQKGEWSVIGMVEPEYVYYVRLEIESRGFTTHGIGQGRFRIVW